MPKGRGASKPKPRKKRRQHLTVEQRIAINEERHELEMAAVALAEVDVAKFGALPKKMREEMESARELASQRVEEAKKRAAAFRKQADKLRTTPLTRKEKGDRTRAVNARVRAELESNCARLAAMLEVGEVEAIGAEDGHEAQLRVIEAALEAADAKLDSLPGGDK